jgi:hypothetical protein
LKLAEVLSPGLQVFTSQCLLRGPVVRKKKVNFKTSVKVVTECLIVATRLMRRIHELKLVPNFTGKVDVDTEQQQMFVSKQLEDGRRIQYPVA